MGPAEENVAILNREMFREYDIRGREAPEELSRETVRLIGLGFASMLRSRGVTKVVVGRDNRSTSAEFEEAMVEALAASGLEVIRLGLVLTPIMYWSQHFFDAPGGVMITASHNPVGWNGLKLAVEKTVTLTSDALHELYSIIEREDFPDVRPGTIVPVEDVVAKYTQDVITRVNVDQGIKVVLNTGNGTAGPIARAVLAAAGCEVIGLHLEPDPSFPNYTPDPATPVMMEATAELVKNSGAAIGFAVDGDGDRLGMVDDAGKVIWPDRFLILLARQVLEKKPGSNIVFDVKCTMALPEDIEAHGGIPVMCPTGHSWVKAKIRQTNAALGGEASGHIFIVDNYYGFDDAIFVALRLLDYVRSAGRPVSELMSTVPSYPSSPTYHVHCSDDRKYEVVRRITEHFKTKYKVIDINGARVVFDDGWGLVRASSNLPAMVLRFEAKTEQRVAEIETMFRQELA